MAADLQAPGLPRRKVLATVVRLLETTFIRVGNEEYARANRSFGLTTLKDRHVSVGGAEMRFHFRGKSGVFHEISIHDAAIARTVRRCRDLPGQELFQYLNEDGQPATIDSADVNEYIRDVAGDEFTAKDYRTWAGTVLAATALCAMGGRASARGGAAPSKRDVVRAIEQVAHRLGNTPSVCRKSYVHPEVIGAFLDGSLARDATFARVLERAPVAALTTAGVLALPVRSNRDLRPEEAAVLALLKRREAESRRGSRLEAQLRRSLRSTRRRRSSAANGRPRRPARPWQDPSVADSRPGARPPARPVPGDEGAAASRSTRRFRRSKPH